MLTKVCRNFGKKIVDLCKCFEFGTKFCWTDCALFSVGTPEKILHQSQAVEPIKKPASQVRDGFDSYGPFPPTAFQNFSVSCPSSMTWCKRTRSGVLVSRIYDSTGKGVFLSGYLPTLIFCELCKIIPSQKFNLRWIQMCRNGAKVLINRTNQDCIWTIMLYNLKNPVK